MIRALVYFALVFGAGFVLGPVRVLGLVPRVGERAAELIEAPVMLAVIVVAARYVVRRMPAGRPVAHLASGVFAMSLVVVLDLTVVLWLRGLSVAEYLDRRDPVAGVVYVGLLITFALMPWLLGRAADQGMGENPRDDVDPGDRHATPEPSSVAEAAARSAAHPGACSEESKR